MKGVFAYTVNRDTPSRPGQTSFSWLQEIFPMDTKRAFHSDGFVFSRLTIAACALPAGNKVHSPDSSLSTAISRFSLSLKFRGDGEVLRPLTLLIIGPLSHLAETGRAKE